jgi:hypothetical protein
MTRWTRLFGAAGVAAVVVVVGAATALATVHELLFAEAKPHARGKLTRTVDGVRFTLHVPTGWETGPVEKIGGKFRSRGLLISKNIGGGQLAEEVIYWIGIHGNGYVTPCANVVSLAASRSRADVAAAIAKTPGTKLGGGPSPTTVGGLPATSVVLRVKKRLDCQPGFFFAWPHSLRECWGACWLTTDAGDSISVWIVDVREKRLFFVAVTKPGAGEWQEIGDIKRSIRFG